MFSEADFCREARTKSFLWLSKLLCEYLSTVLCTFRVDEHILRK